MDPHAIRERSVQTAKRLGFPINLNLPILEEDLNLRGQAEIVDRALVLHVIVANAYGFDGQSAIAWLEAERLGNALLEPERSALEGKKGQTIGNRILVEALWAICWSLSIVEELDFGQYCSDDLVTLLPDLSVAETSAQFREQVILRPVHEVIESCDLAYLLDWGLIHSRLHGTKLPGKVHPYVIQERRRALEWLLSDVDWYEVSLDT